MTTYFTSDLHLGHQAVIKFCERPFATVEEMDDVLTGRWNATVKPIDTIYVLGDLSFHKYATGHSQISQLNGKKFLIQGNHDRWSKTQYEACGFTLLQECVIKLLGTHIRLSHYPYWPLDTSMADQHDLRYPLRRPRNSGGWLLCGHVHDKWKLMDRQINVGVDVWNYSPVSENSIGRIIAKGIPQ